MRREAGVLPERRKQVAAIGHPGRVGGEQRAKAVRAYLTALGVSEDRVRVVTYGEEKPLDSAQSEAAWAKNRRGEIIVN